MGRGRRAANRRRVRLATALGMFLSSGAFAQPDSADAGSNALSGSALAATDGGANPPAAVDSIRVVDAPAPVAPPVEQPSAPADPPTQLDDEADLERLLTVPVVSAASRTAESASDAPATTWIISGTDLRRFGIQSVEEAIRYLGHGTGSTPRSALVATCPTNDQAGRQVRRV